jgi:ubiquinone/menaquinone biosynthesis C-methylase UbiE
MAKEADISSLLQIDSEKDRLHFEQIYLDARKKEQRLYTDAEVSLLPEISGSHRHSEEWRIRKCSAGVLFKHLAGKQRPLAILEIGCGNGWLSSLLAELPNSFVIGNDRNSVEIEQARRVFGKKTNLSFENGDFQQERSAESFDIVVFAASIQYFKDFHQTVLAGLRLLRKGGELHILDTFFYTRQNVESACQRSKYYYIKLGVPEMTELYFHHTLDQVEEFSYKVLSNPNSLKNRLLFHANPFYWFAIYP